MQEIKVYENKKFGKIRTLEVNGEHWFIGKDVATALGYKRTTKAVRDHVDTLDICEVPIQDTIGRVQYTPAINESGVYTLTFNSELPNAQAFKRWVTSEVLPSIRKYGAYLTPQTLEKTIQDPDYLIGILENLKTLQLNNLELTKQVELDKPKVLFADAVSSSNKTILIRQLAKILKQNGFDIGEKRLYEQLRQDGYLIKRDGDDKNTPTQKAMDLELFRVKETAISHSNGKVTISFTTKVTGKGQSYFVNKYANKMQLTLL